MSIDLSKNSYFSADKARGYVEAYTSTLLPDPTVDMLVHLRSGFLKVCLTDPIQPESRR